MATKDWVPGDVGYVKGGGRDLYAGEWIVDIGAGQFWGFGFGEGDPKSRTMEGWFSFISTWPGTREGFVPLTDERRYYPGVGLK